MDDLFPIGAAQATDRTPGLSPGKGLVVLACVIAGVAAYIGIGTLLGIIPLYAGFLFSVYFGGIKQCEAKEFPAALLGSLGGLAIGATLYWLPHYFGSAGLAAALALIIVTLYALVMGWARILVNDANMMMLTVASIPAVQKEMHFGGMACAILLAAALMGALVLITGVLARPKDDTSA